jgi:Glycosyl transferases, related to UDP-glucuronosyltransferase
MKILICPLNWGLGHATRCVPLIRRLINEGNDIVIASDGYPLAFLQQEFPSLSIVEIPSYRIRYSSGKTQTFVMLRNMPSIVGGVVREHRWLRRYLQTNNNIDMIISDNRFGLWSKRVKSIYITHQLMIKMPCGLAFLEPVAWRLHRMFINRYSACWIPDTSGEDNFSGDLAHKYPLPKNAEFIDILSRFQGLESIAPNTDFSTVCVLSGIEPQRSIFEESLIERFRNSKTQTLIVRGQPQAEKQTTKNGYVTLVSHLSTEEMAAYFRGATKIISRSGYSTIMDLAVLNCLSKAELIPTPGQTEQEYLSEYHKLI